MAVDGTTWASPVLDRLLEDADRPAAGSGGPGRPTIHRRSRGGWHVVVTGDVYTTGVVGNVLEKVRTRRHRVTATIPEGLVRLAAAVDATVTGDGHLTKDGSLLVPVQHPRGRALLRVAVGDSAAALEVAAAAHDRFGAAIHTIPGALAHTRVDDVAVTVEQRLPGRRPGRVTDRLVGDVANTLAEVAPLAAAGERGGTAADAIHDRADEVVRRCPSGTDLGTVHLLAAWAAARLGDRPTGLEHGDLWHRNLLVHRGRLTGIVDWDSWSAQGIDGVDLVMLVATWEQHRAGVPVGTAVANRLWRSRVGLLARLGVDPDDLDALGIAWWLSVVAGTLRRVPARRTDADWRAAAFDAAALATRWTRDAGRTT